MDSCHIGGRLSPSVSPLSFMLLLFVYFTLIFCLVGKPVHVEQCDKPTLEEVMRVQAKYIEELTRWPWSTFGFTVTCHWSFHNFHSIWNTYKDKFAKARLRELEIIDWTNCPCRRCDYENSSVILWELAFGDQYFFGHYVPGCHTLSPYHTALYIIIRWKCDAKNKYFELRNTQMQWLEIKCKSWPTQTRTAVARYKLTRVQCCAVMSVTILLLSYDLYPRIHHTCCQWEISTISTSRYFVCFSPSASGTSCRYLALFELSTLQVSISRDHPELFRRRAVQGGVFMGKQQPFCWTIFFF